MATAQASETRISSTALSLLDCYAAELNEIIYAAAAEIAGERLRNSLPAGQPVRIDVEDVKQAAELVGQAIRERFGNDPKHAAFVKSVEGMNECLKTRCEMAAANKHK